MIAKGTVVTITTTNGGRVTDALAADYRPSYAVTVRNGAGVVSVPAWRVASVEVAA